MKHENKELTCACGSIDREVLRVAHGHCQEQTLAAAEARIAAGHVDDKTLLECKNEVVGRLANEVFPAFVRSLHLE